MSVKALQEYTRISKYARFNPALKRRETWEEQVTRVFDMHRGKFGSELILKFQDDFDFAEKMVMGKRVLGSQRALQFGGAPIIKKNARMYNCSASYCDRPRFFQEIMWLLLCGAGAGFSVQKHHIAKLPSIKSPLKSGKGKKTFVIPDDIEGWSDAIGVLLSSYFDSDLTPFPEYKGYIVEFDFSKIRPAGAPLSSGSKAPGPDGLKGSLVKIEYLLDRVAKQKDKLDPIDAYDIVMHSSDAVLSGGVRRSATICIFSADDEVMLKAKTGSWRRDNPQRGRSNNSVLLLREKTTKEEFEKYVSYVKEFGEPGFIWADDLEFLMNPCGEISLFAKLPLNKELREKYASEIKIQDNEKELSGWQVCNLSEINVKKAKTEEEFLQACRAASIIGTMQAAYTSFDYLGPITELIIKKEALLGVSMTGMADNPDIAFDPKLQRKGAKLILETNEKIAAILGINKCARATCIKPAGCQVKETMISTDNGIMALEEIGDTDSDSQWQPQDFNVNTDQGKKKSTNFYVNGYSETTKILLDSGIILESTNNHKYRVINENNEYVWKEACEIQEGDALPYSVGDYDGGGFTSLNQVVFEKNKHDSHGKDMVQPKVLDEKMAWFLGLYFGDGSNHTRSIRIHCNKTEKKEIEVIASKIFDIFGIRPKYMEDKREGNRCCLCINSIQLLKWLEVNGLLKDRSYAIGIPLKIRTSPKNVIAAFIDGFGDADGCDKNPSGMIYCTTSENFARQLVVVLRAIGRDAKMRLMPTVETSYGNRMRYWIQERKGRSGEINKDRTYRRGYYSVLDKLGLTTFSIDRVVSIESSSNYTFDLEVPDNKTYFSNSYVSHNTSSCILGTASGIHPHHAVRYFRRVQANKMEAPLKYFEQFNPMAVEESVWSTHKTDKVVTFLCEVPAGAKTKNQTDAITLLEMVKSTQQNWVDGGTRLECCLKPWLMHNVSNTINIKPEEWNDVINFIFKNKKWFTGISMLPVSGDKDYPQAPFTAIFTPSEIVKEYGDGSILASGLVVDGLRPFENNLWASCDCALGIGEIITVPALREKIRKDCETNGVIWKQEGLSPESPDKLLEAWLKHNVKNYEEKTEWIRRAVQFANRYFGGDLRKMTYCLKDVTNWKLWCDLSREYKEVDWSKCYEDEDGNIDFGKESACGSGACELGELGAHIELKKQEAKNQVEAVA